MNHLAFQWFEYHWSNSRTSHQAQVARLLQEKEHLLTELADQESLSVKELAAAIKQKQVALAELESALQNQKQAIANLESQRAEQLRDRQNELMAQIKAQWQQFEAQSASHLLPAVQSAWNLSPELPLKDFEAGLQKHQRVLAAQWEYFWPKLLQQVHNTKAQAAETQAACLESEHALKQAKASLQHLQQELTDYGISSTVQQSLLELPQAQWAVLQSQLQQLLEDAKREAQMSFLTSVAYPADFI